MVHLKKLVLCPYVLLHFCAEADICFKVGFRVEEGQPKESPTSAAVRFSSLEGVDCDCAADHQGGTGPTRPR